jgi:hypothetical protein
MASPDFVCARCDTEYRFEGVVRARRPVPGEGRRGRVSSGAVRRRGRLVVVPPMDYRIYVTL